MPTVSPPVEMVEVAVVEVEMKWSKVSVLLTSKVGVDIVPALSDVAEIDVFEIEPPTMVGVLMAVLVSWSILEA